MLALQYHYQIAQSNHPFWENRLLFAQATTSGGSGTRDDQLPGIEQQPEAVYQPEQREDDQEEQTINQVQTAVHDKALHKIPGKEEILNELQGNLSILRELGLSTAELGALMKLGIDTRIITEQGGAGAQRMLLDWLSRDFERTNQMQEGTYAWLLQNKRPQQIGSVLSHMRGRMRRLSDHIANIRQQRELTAGNKQVGTTPESVLLRAQTLLRFNNKNVNHLSKNEEEIYTFLQLTPQQRTALAKRIKTLYGADCNMGACLHDWLSKQLSDLHDIEVGTPLYEERQLAIEAGYRIIQGELKIELAAFEPWLQRWQNANMEPNDIWNTYGVGSDALSEALREAHNKRVRAKELLKPDAIHDAATEIEARTLIERMKIIPSSFLQQEQEREQALEKNLRTIALSYAGIAQHYQDENKRRWVEEKLGIDLSLIEAVLLPYTKDTVQPSERAEVLKAHSVWNMGRLVGLLRQHAHASGTDDTPSLLENAVENRAQVEAGIQAMEQSASQETADTITGHIESTRVAIGNTVDSILNHEAFNRATLTKHLQLPHRLQQKQQELEVRLNNSDQLSLYEKQEALVEAQMHAQSLHSFYARLEQSKDGLVVVEQPAEQMQDVRGFYDHRNNTIVINASLSPEAKQLIREHEENHKFMRDLIETGAIPDLRITSLNTIREQLLAENNGDESLFNTFKQALIDRARNEWGYAKTQDPQELLELALEELLVKYIEYQTLLDKYGNSEEKIAEVVRSGQTSLSKGDIDLLKYLEGSKVNLGSDAGVAGYLHHVQGNMSNGERYANGDGDDGGNAGATGGQGGNQADDGTDGDGQADQNAADNPDEQNPNRPPEDEPERDPDLEASDDDSDAVKEIKEKLSNVRRIILKSSEFNRAYGDTDLIRALNTLESEYEKAKNIFIEGDGIEQNMEYFDALIELEEEAGGVEKYVQALRDESKEPDSLEMHGKEGIAGFLGSINWMSLNDMWKMCKDAWEDFTRIWERRSQQKRSEVGSDLTDWIGDRVPYAGRLKHEFDRRSQESEVEEVNKWEGALENKDAYDVIGMFRTARNKDQIKALIINLTKRGRMDWSNRDFLAAMNAVSNYTMPIEKCLIDNELRNSYLGKMVADIWGDKDQFQTWKKENDDQMISEKDKFKQTVNELANRGGMEKDLERMLQIHIGIREGRYPKEMRDQINPHRYMEILHYAIRNGKMTMEDKFFYLIQGVAHEVIPIDYLTWMSGDGGEILNQFPFIDYFYGKNNTLPEIQQLAARLTEDGDPTKSGVKTSLFLQFEVAKSDRAISRASKGLLSRAQAVDHEDIPMATALAGYSIMDNILSTQEGVPKITHEGMKNMYVGYGSIFKSHARLVQMEGRGEAKMSKRDAAVFAERVTAYIHSDNIIAKNADDSRGNRPNISLHEIEQQSGPSSGGVKVGEFRGRNNKLVRDIVKRLENEGIYNWQNALNENTQGITLDEFLNADGLGGRRSTAKRQKILNATEGFQTELIRSLGTEEGMSVLRAVLRENANNLIEEQAGLNKDRTVNHHYTLEKTEEYFNEFNTAPPRDIREERQDILNMDIPKAAPALAA